MPKGGARPNAGRPRKPLAEHLARGTYRPDRHGPRPIGNVLAMPAPVTDWRPTNAERSELGDRARDWLDAVLNLFAIDDLEGRRLLEALRTLTRIEQLEAAVKAAGVADATGTPHPALAALAREGRLFQSQWAALQLGRA